MDLADRLRLILSENNLKQKDFAAAIGVTESYISALLGRRNEKLSLPLANLIEEKYGYNSLWILDGLAPKLKQVSKNPLLSDVHQRALAQIEKMDSSRVRAVLAFINSLDEVENALRGNDNLNI